MAWRDEVWQAVRLIPRARVCAYADVAAFLGHPLRARQVGNALGALDEPNSRIVPWHRVVNVRGFISINGQIVGKDMQRALLQHEGVDVDDKYTVVGFDSLRWSFPAPSL
ncbi:MAG: MGMT family protein [Deltaproteobacteria bacterium]|nr:MGMT family protein [Deltaproteobacteria bacterium]